MIFNAKARFRGNVPLSLLIPDFDSENEEDKL